MSEGCQVDFYTLGSRALDDRRLACKLALMAWERGHRVAIVTEGDADARALDDLMWEYPGERFLPHDRTAGGNAAPVSILTAPPDGPADVVINLTAHALPEPGRFARLLEIVPHRPGDRDASREKFRAYRALGIEPHHHEIG